MAEGYSTAPLTGLAPLANSDTRLLVLGSFPSVRSLELQQYYGHPQNHFWRILGTLWGLPLRESDYAVRRAAALAHGVGIWDVYASCEREGSLDSAIRHAVVNDLAGLRARCPDLRAIAHNGGESWRQHRHTEGLGVPVYRLPSTSPANASWSFERKLAPSREVFLAVGIDVPDAGSAAP